MLCGCNGNSRENSDTEPVRRLDPIDSDSSRYSRSFTLSDGANNFLINFSEEKTGILAITEDNEYNASQLIISPPEGYSPLYTNSFCDILVNDIDTSKTVPDIIRLSFSDGSDTVCRFFTVSQGKLAELAIMQEGSSETFSYVQRSDLYRSEPFKFIDRIIIDENEDPTEDLSEAVKVFTYTFDPDNLTLTGKYEDLSEKNPLYFGYAYWGLANNIASCFADTNFHISNDDVKEVKGDNNKTLYFYKTADPRFSDTDGLQKYMRKIFTSSAAEKVTSLSHGKISDINGSLYTQIENAPPDPSLGMLTFTSYAFSTSGNTIFYTTRQEKFDENGNVAGYTDGGEFKLSKSYYEEYDGGLDEYTEKYVWKISEYRYPYSSENY